MVEIADITDMDSLHAWLENQPREVSVWIAARAAARVLPVWWQAVLTDYEARSRDLTPLQELRRLFISSVAALVTTNDIRLSVRAAVAYSSAVQSGYTAEAGAAIRAAHSASGFAANAAETDRTVYAACNAAYYAAKAARANSENSYFARASAADTVWTALQTDAEQASGGSLPDALPLWPDESGPFADEWSGIKARLTEAPDAANWQFWLDWYDSQLAGRIMLSDPARTRDMLEKIALIDRATWEAGPGTVNPVIREIWELYRLRVEVAALQAEKKAFLAARASEAQRSHNQPPEGLVDDQPELARQITIVWDSLDEARDELEQDAPDKGRLREIAEKLLSALTSIARYCAKVADTAVISAAKVGGGAVGTAILDHVANNGRLMQFAKDLLTHASGG